MSFLDVAPAGPVQQIAEGGLFAAILFVACVALIVIAIIVGVLLLIKRSRKKKEAAAAAQQAAYAQAPEAPADGNKTE